MRLDENIWGVDIQHDWLWDRNLVLNFLRKSVLSTTEFLGNRSDNRFIDNCWSIYRFFRKRETRHSETLNRAYKELERLNITEDDRHYVTLNAIKQFEDIQYFHQAIQHMRSYQELFEVWNKLDKLQKQSNSLLEELEPILRNSIRTKASEPENYPKHIAIFEKPNTASKNQDCYNMHSLMNDVYDFLYYDEPDGKLLKDYLCYEKSFDNSYLLTHQKQDIVIESKKESDSKRAKLISLLESVVADQNLRKKFSDLRSTRNDLNDTIRDFRFRVTELSDDIDLGHMIRGKCRLGY